MNKRTALRLLVALTNASLKFALAAALAIVSTKAAFADAGTFPIGAIVSLSGDCADVGDVSRKGLELAAEEVNASGGILGKKIQLTVEDTKETSSINAVTAFKHITLNPELHYLIGPSCTPAGLAVAPIAAKLPNIILASPSIGLRQFNEAGENIFKLWPYDEDGPKLLAKYAIEKGWKRVAIFSSQQAWEQAQGNFFAAEFRKLGGEVVAKVEPLQSEHDLRTEAMKLVRSDPDFVLLCDYIQFDIAAQELVRQGYKGPKLSTLMTAEKVELAKGALEGTVAYGYEPASPVFVERYTKKYGQAPNSIGADNAYDALHLIARAINEVGADNPQMVRKKLREVKNYPGASGVFSIDGHGGVVRSPILFVVEKGKLLPLKR